MNDDRTNDERLAQMIRAAAPRREIPVGLDTRIMAQIRLHGDGRLLHGCRCCGACRDVRLSADDRLAGRNVAASCTSGGYHRGDGNCLR